jgi:hypothetical protein
MANDWGIKRVAEVRLSVKPEQPKHPSRPQRVSIHLKVTNLTGKGVGKREFEGRMEAIEGGKARICLGHPMAGATKVKGLVEFKAGRNREIQFRAKAKVAPVVSRLDMAMEECVGISGKDLREILGDCRGESCSPQYGSMACIKGSKAVGLGTQSKLWFAPYTHREDE